MESAHPLLGGEGYITGLQTTSAAVRRNLLPLGVGRRPSSNPLPLEEGKWLPPVPFYGLAVTFSGLSHPCLLFQPPRVPVRLPDQPVLFLQQSVLASGFMQRLALLPTRASIRNPVVVAGLGHADKCRQRDEDEAQANPTHQIIFSHHWFSSFVRSGNAITSSISAICFLSARLSNSLFLTPVRIRHLTISTETIVYNFLKNTDFQKQGNAPRAFPNYATLWFMESRPSGIGLPSAEPVLARGARGAMRMRATLFITNSE